MPDNIKAMMQLIEPTLRAKDAEAAKRQKISCISYWITFCAAYSLDAAAYRTALLQNDDAGTLTVLEEMAMLAGFAGYVVM